MDNLSDVFGNAIGFIMLFVLFFLSYMCFKAMIINIIDKFKPASKLMRCESCGRQISTSAYVCPHCGQHYGSSSAFNSILVCFVIGSFLLLGGLYCLSLFLEEYGYDIFILKMFN
ncbi:hypothetical protein [Paenibacillus illinoisensis]|uniref:hypothetical protein n=1 Tax=Paenibacillus illinoisensis TaxID=59845 RepID=UPI00301BDE55